jgi:hypothetical protein
MSDCSAKPIKRDILGISPVGWKFLFTLDARLSGYNVAWCDCHSWLWRRCKRKEKGYYMLYPNIGITNLPWSYLSNTGWRDFPSIVNGSLVGSNPPRGIWGRMAPRSGTQRFSIRDWAGGTILLTGRVRSLWTSGLTGKSSTTGTTSLPVIADNSLATHFNSGLMPTGAARCWPLGSCCSLLGSVPADPEPCCRSLK